MNVICLQKKRSKLFKISCLGKKKKNMKLTGIAYSITDKLFKLITASPGCASAKVLVPPTKYKVSFII